MFRTVIVTMGISIIGYKGTEQKGSHCSWLMFVIRRQNGKPLYFISGDANANTKNITQLEKGSFLTSGRKVT